MKNKKNKKGFTLAELLIVVAIIAVLVAIAIPIFSAQLNKSKDATNLANARSIYAQLTADYLDDNAISAAPSGSYDGSADADITVDGNKYHFTKVDGTKLTIDTSAEPKVTYKGLDGDHVFGKQS